MLDPTPGQTIGPFFHDAMRYHGADDLTPPGGADAIRLHGTVFDGAGAPVSDALIEIRHSDGGWGRCPTNAAGDYCFSIADPVQFISVVVFARGLLDRLFTRAYPAGCSDPFLDRLTARERSTLTTIREGDGSLRFDIHLQGDHETVFLTFVRDSAGA